MIFLRTQIPNKFPTLYFLLLLFIACQSGPQDQSILTFSATLGDFKVTVRGDGELEAIKSYVLTVPNVNTQPEIANLAPEGSFARKGDIVVELEAEEVMVKYRQARDDVEIARAEAQKKEAELNLQRLLLESQIKSDEASLKTARLQMARLEFEAPTTREIKQLEIKEQELMVERNQKKLVSLAKIRKEEMSHMELRIKQAQNQLKQSKDFLDKLLLKSPTDGIVVYERSWMTGEKVQEGDALYPNMPVVKIPDLSGMQANLKVGETDAQKIEVGQIAVISIPILGEVEIPGRVSRVDQMAQPIKRGSKIKRVEVIVELDTTFSSLVPGLTATVSIEIMKSEGGMSVPRECLFEKDAVKFVYALRDRRFVPLPIEIAQQNDDFLFIRGDLQATEEIALRKPVDSAITWPDTLRPFQTASNANGMKMINQKEEDR